MQLLWARRVRGTEFCGWGRAGPRGSLARSRRATGGTPQPRRRLNTHSPHAERSAPSALAVARRRLAAIRSATPRAGRGHPDRTARRRPVAERVSLLQQVPWRQQYPTGKCRPASRMDTAEHDTLYWHWVDEERIQCDVCPRACKLRAGQRGLCFVRGHEGGSIKLLTYGRSSGFCVDPIEKKPLNHYLPGSSVLSFGTAGC